MTAAQVLHTELLAQLDETLTLDGWEDVTGAWRAAARGVLELHKPEFFGGVIACLACSPGMPPPLLVDWSKCETVKVIAVALGVDHG